MYDIKYLNKEKTTYIEVRRAEEEDGVHVVPIIKFESYRNEKWLTHGFSTRLGGFSSGIYSSMNLSFSQGDDERFVRKNHYLMADSFGVKPDNIVYSHQTHTTKLVLIVLCLMLQFVTRTQCFLNADGTYDWSKQAGQRKFLKTPTPTIDRDRTVSRRSEPSSRATLMGRRASSLN